MPQTHLTIDEVDRCRRHALAVDEIVRIYAHIEECGDCCARVRQSTAPAMIPVALEAELMLTALQESEHLTDLQIGAYVDEILDPIDRELAAAHLEICPTCRAEVAQVWMLLETIPKEAVAPIHNAAMSLRQLSGRVVLDNRGGISLDTAPPLPPSLAERVRELANDGLAAPTRAFKSVLSAWRRASLPVAALRGLPHPLSLSPSATTLRTLPPTLRWQEVPDAHNYTVVVVHEAKTGRTTLWKESVSGETRIVMPTDVLLQPGELYVWQVTASVGGKERRSPFVWFAALSAKEVREVEKGEHAASGSALALAALYERYGLYAEAQAQLEYLMEANPGSVHVRQMLERLRAQRQQEPPVE